MAKLDGGHIDSIFQVCDAVGIKVIGTRHEQTAALMSEGWARATGKPGVTAVTAGPGVTNAITGLWNTSITGAPMVLFGGKAELENLNGGPSRIWIRYHS